MTPIQFECPHCHAIGSGDETQYGQRVTCSRCGATILVPPAPVSPEPQTARLIPGPAERAPAEREADIQEPDIFNLAPAARAFAGQMLLALLFFVGAAGLGLRAKDFVWAPPAALVLLALGVASLLLVWIKVKSSHYRLTTQRLFVRRGWMAQRVDELELYRVKDVMVDQSALQRLLGFGTITVVADDDTTPQMDLVRVARPTFIKEMIRTQYRAARHREGVRPTEFMRSP